MRYGNRKYHDMKFDSKNSMIINMVEKNMI